MLIYVTYVETDPTKKAILDFYFKNNILFSLSDIMSITVIFLGA